MGHIYTKIDVNSCSLVEDQYGVSDELLNWLKNSCIKTEAGADIVCYHGSPSNEKFAVFNDSTSYGCKSFIGFFSLDRDFAECYTDDGEDTSYSRIRSFAINSKKLFDIKNPACVQFLGNHLPNTIICNGDTIDSASFVEYLITEKLPVNNYKLTVDKFNDLEMFKHIGKRILGDSGWEYSCTLEKDKKLHNQYFLGTDPENNSVFVLDFCNIIKPKYVDRSYSNTDIEGIYLDTLQVTFDKALSTGLLTSTHLSMLSQGQPIDIKLSAEEFINMAYNGSFLPEDLTEKERQLLRGILHNPSYDNIDLSVDVTLSPIKVSLDEFNKGMGGGRIIDKTDNTWELYEKSYCIIDDQKIHIVDWLKSKGFDAIVVKEDWTVNIICLYKNMIKDLKNKMPTDSDNVYENYHYSDALLADLI